MQTPNGLGQHQDVLSASQIDKFYKVILLARAEEILETDSRQFDYVSNLLFILNLCFAKLSVIQMLRIITPVKLHVRIVLGTGAFIVAWSFASELAAAFQCEPPNPWKVIENQCFDRVCTHHCPRWFLEARFCFAIIESCTDLIAGSILEFLWSTKPNHRSRAVGPPTCHRVEDPDTEDEKGGHILLLRIADSVCLAPSRR